MKISLLSRRNFIQKSLMASAVAAAVPGLAQAKPLARITSDNLEDYSYRNTIKPPPDKDANKEKVVLLIGSVHNKSLEMRVQRLLEDKACVYTPALSCGNTLDVLRNLEGWLKTYDPDVVHFMTGHEDLRSTFYGTYENMIPKAFYRRNMTQIIDFVFGFSDKAVPIWATITPVNDDWIVSDKSKVRDWTFFSDDVEVYNKEAMKLCRKMKVTVNDLYEVCTYNGVDPFLTQNGYELNGKGLSAVAKAIASQIENMLV